VASFWRRFASRFSQVGFAANATLPLFRIRTIRPDARSASWLGWVLGFWTLRVLKLFRKIDAPVRASGSTPIRLRETKTQACFLVRFTERYRLFTGERFALLVVRVCLL
jgi:hypothetical protein